jgi:hypothetical protein
MRLGGAAVAQHGAVAAREHGGHPQPSLSEARMAHGVDAPVEAVKPTGLRSPAHAITCKSRIEELRVRDDSVLATG